MNKLSFQMFSFPLGMLNIHKSPLDLLLWFDSLSSYYAVLVEGLHAHVYSIQIRFPAAATTEWF